MNVKMTVHGVDEAIRALIHFRDDIDKKARLMTSRLADEGVLVAQMYYSTAEYAGDNDVVVMALSEDGTQWKIIASGYATLFIEFGSGITMPDAPQARSELVSGEGIVGHGEYGLGKGANEKGWFYKGSLGNIHPESTQTSTKYPGLIHTYGNPATPAMYYSKKHMEEILLQVAQEVFS